MRFALIVLVLVCALAEAAPRSKPKKGRITTRKAPATKSTPTKSAEPAPPKREKGDWELATAISLAGGGFIAGGANRGPSVGATLTLTPSLVDGRFSLDVDLNWRMAQFTTGIEPYGALTSTLHAFPLLAALRMRALAVERLTVDVRGGLGPLLLFHHLSSDFGQRSTRSALGWEAFVAGQARVPISSVELTGELRAGLGEAHIPLVLGRATGVQAMIGVRYALP